MKKVKKPEDSRKFMEDFDRVYAALMEMAEKNVNALSDVIGTINEDTYADALYFKGEDVPDYLILGSGAVISMEVLAMSIVSIANSANVLRENGLI